MNVIAPNVRNCAVTFVRDFNGRFEEKNATLKKNILRTKRKSREKEKRQKTHRIDSVDADTTCMKFPSQQLRQHTRRPKTELGNVIRTTNLD
jgi:hypothetical protein